MRLEWLCDQRGTAGSVELLLLLLLPDIFVLSSNVLGFGQGRLAKSRVGHARPIRLANHKTHGPHLLLLVLLFDVSPPHLQFHFRNEENVHDILNLRGQLLLEIGYVRDCLRNQV